MATQLLGAFRIYIIARICEGEKMKRLRYQSKNKHVTIALDVYSPRETVAMWKQDVKKFRTWLHTPKNKRRKLFEFKIEKK